MAKRRHNSAAQTLSRAAMAVAEKVSALRTESYIAERAARPNVPKALRMLKRAGVGQRAMKGDVPQSLLSNTLGPSDLAVLFPSAP